MTNFKYSIGQVCEVTLEPKFSGEFGVAFDKRAKQQRADRGKNPADVVKVIARHPTSAEPEYRIVPYPELEYLREDYHRSLYEKFLKPYLQVGKYYRDTTGAIWCCFDGFTRKAAEDLIYIDFRCIKIRDKDGTRGETLRGGSIHFFNSDGTCSIPGFVQQRGSDDPQLITLCDPPSFTD